jgi:hypothetical protein
MQHSILFVDPQYDPDLVLAPYKPLHINVANCFVDTRLTYMEANTALTDLHAACTIIPQRYFTTASTSVAADSVAQAECLGVLPPPASHVAILARNKELRVHLPLPSISAFIDPDLAATLHVTAFPTNAACISRLRGDISCLNGVYYIAPPVPVPAGDEGAAATTLWGHVSLDETLSSLSSLGVDPSVERSVEETTIAISQWNNAKIVIDYNGGCKVVATDESTRNKIHHLLLKQLDTL